MSPTLPPSEPLVWPRRRFAAALGSLSALAAWPAAAQFRVEITGVGATRIPIAIAPLRDEAMGGVAVSSVVRSDLERSGVFRVMQADASLDERSSVASAVAQPRRRRTRPGRLSRLAMAATTCATRCGTWCARGVARASKVVPAADLRLGAHRVADEIYQQLTGERGVFATRIAYVARSGGRYTLHVADADGQGGQVALTSTESIISPAWSPDGRHLAYVSFESQKAVVWTQDLGSGARRKVADQGGFNSAPAWSPDGSRLVVTMSQGGVAQLYTLPATGGTRRGCVRSAIDTEAPFSPTQANLFVSDRGGGSRIRVDDGAARRTGELHGGYS